jgi:hypothetical protein
VIEVDASLETTAEGEEAVRCAAAEAESRCLISHALDVPVHVAVTIDHVAVTIDAAGAQTGKRIEESRLAEATAARLGTGD